MEGIQIQYRIADLREGRFFVQNAASLNIETVRKGTTYIVTVDTGVDKGTNHIVINFDLKLTPKNKDNTILMHYVASMSYEVHGFELVMDGMDTPSIPTVIMQTLMAATYSTFRGIIYARCGGSILREAILPLADPLFFINEERIVKGGLVAKDLPSTE